MKNLTPKTIKTLFPSAASRTYKKGQIICYMGDKPHHIFFVIKGHIKYYDIDENGNEKILHIIGPHNIFPMLYAFDITKDVTAFYSTLDAVDILIVPLSEFRKIIETNIEFANALTRWFLTEINQLVYRINSFEKNDARNKILHTLKYLALNYGRRKRAWLCIDFPITQQFIADFTGLTRETVSAAMGELSKDKIIQTNKLCVLDIKHSEVQKSS